MAAKKDYAVGKEIEAWCTKCKMDRLHNIETLKSDGNINRVICQTCQGSHLFRRPKGPDGTGTKPAKRRKKGDLPITEAELGKAKGYAMDGEFAVSEVLTHVKFGPGRVMAVKPGGKMEVSFEDSTRTLKCKNAGSFLNKRRSTAAKLIARLEEASKDEDKATKPAAKKA
jgi:hypothetical protein